ncbi:MAG TPA: PQQ-binding-like beta-propeller repeat protein [Pirellulales bacterium]|nr:PQQ-binding-like beta-propeller repeat protein [Pirellulales bacterium]
MHRPASHLILCLALFAAILVAPPSAAADGNGAVSGNKLASNGNWPQFRGPDGQGHSDATGLPVRWSETQGVVWKTPIHGRGWSSPVVWGGQIWLTTATEDGKQLFAVCVDAASGHILHDRKLFEVAQPQAIHTFNSYASPTPVIEAGRVYVSFGSAGTACLDTADGHVVWQRRNLPCNHFRGPGSSPVLFQNLLFLHFDGYDYQYIVALDKQTGKTIWRRDRDIDYGTADGDMKKAFSTPLVIDVEGQLQLISPCSKATLAYDPRTGKELWRVHYSSFSSTARPIFGDGLLFLNTGFGKADLLAVRPPKIVEAAEATVNNSAAGKDAAGKVAAGKDAAGKDTLGKDITATNVVWKLSKSVGSKPSALLVGDLIYLVHDSGVASCVEAQSGMVLWSKRLGSSFSASPVAADGRIYYFGENGTTTVLRVGRDYEELAVNHLDDGFMSSPALTGHALIVRTKTNLYRIEQK